MFKLSLIYFFTFLIKVCIILTFNSANFSNLHAQTPPTIALSAYDTVICPGDSIYLEASISGQLPIEINYEITINNNLIQKTISSLTKPLKFDIHYAGSYTITSYSDNNTTIDTNISFIVNEVNPPTASLYGGGQFCANESIEAIDVVFTGSPPWKLTYQNNFGNAVVQTFKESRNELLNTEGIINIRKVSDLHCRTDLYDTNIIELFEIPIAEISGADELCPQGSSNYSTVYNNTYKYKWIVPDAATTNIGEDFQANSLPLIWNTAGEYSLELIVEVKNTGCNSGSIFYQVKIHDFPKVLQEFDTVLCFERENFLRINPANQTNNTIYWPHLNDFAQEIDIYEPGEYSYIESIPFGCEATGNFRVIDKCIPEIYVAEAFSPNGDGINDLLEIKGVYYNLFISIYSSIGELIYIKSPNMPAWDGTMKGVNMPIGDYYWKADFTDKFGANYSDEGWVTLIR